MFYIILTLHILLCVTLIGLVLIQQGKGADMGAAFGGGANTLFGAGGATNLIVRVTTGVAVAFMLTSILLVKTYSSVDFTATRGGPAAGVEDSAIADHLEAAEAAKQKPIVPPVSEAPKPEQK